MARYRREIEAQESTLARTVIETLNKACPICKGDVKGDDTYLFYCKGCNLLFRREELFLENPERLHDLVENKILERYERDKEKFKMEHEPIKLKPLKMSLLDAHRSKRSGKKPEKKDSHIGVHHDSHTAAKMPAKTPVKTQAKTLYVASKSRDKLHRSDCQFVRNIDKSNRKTYSSISEARKDKPYKMCRCINRKNK